MEMKTAWIWTEGAAAAIGGLLGWYLGGLDGPLYALIAFIAADYATGVLLALSERRLSSEAGARGIGKKVAILALVGVGHLADAYLLGGDGAALRTAVVFFYLANEGLSLVENAAALGLPVPDALKGALAQIKGKADGTDGAITGTDGKADGTDGGEGGRG
jgi:toxin secretion/phage lysis holin